ncbi:hypothetical protein SAMN05444671_3944 [Flavobacterium sp. CF108]|uniref:AbiTii domain-containing protein n=1 Tax=unclassified Flavobacterium TaxID=196869 RepID=UPI0008B46F60|nr:MULTISPECIES: hypothetical protein [unclassified Flavobacterium]SEO94272.1 hypothetical protein SAMN04487978_4028 [Flavobacterium sp. fv08]SHH82884.1 hypothetical protein SAMN05444671_3944 [Flavobacterium sp. CF108]
MIKQLIKDIAYDSISLSKALTIAKLIAAKIKNQTFKNWLTKELEGYEYDDVTLPDYRKVWSPITLIAEFTYGRTQPIVVVLTDEFDKDEFDFVNRHQISEPISIVEEQIKTISKSKGYINLPAKQVEAIAGLYSEDVHRHGGIIRTGSREVGRVQYQNVLEMTKQKLLDTLMELDNEFPNLDDAYNVNKENTDKVQNIITNIFGDNNPLNIAAGNNNKQILNQNNYLPQETEKKLEELGVSAKEILDLKTIIESTADKPTKTSKIMKWLGSVSASVAGKGLYENLPVITEFVHNLII